MATENITRAVLLVASEEIGLSASKVLNAAVGLSAKAVTGPRAALAAVAQLTPHFLVFEAGRVPVPAMQAVKNMAELTASLGSVRRDSDILAQSSESIAGALEEARVLWTRKLDRELPAMVFGQHGTDHLAPLHFWSSVARCRYARGLSRRGIHLPCATDQWRISVTPLPGVVPATKLGL